MPKDPYLINPEEGKEMDKFIKGPSMSVICPKRNRTISGECKVCEKVSRLYQKGDKESVEVARQKKAKVNWFLNVVHASNPNKSFILEIGRNAGNEIKEGITKKGWNDIAHPKAGKGRELEITKQKVSGKSFNQYPVHPILTRADWDISDEVLENLPNLDNIFEMIENGELTEDNYMNISSIKDGETFQFRMCPPAKDAKVFKYMVPVWRHWGVSKSEIEGDEDVDWMNTEESKPEKEEKDTPPWEEQPIKKEEKEDKVENEEDKMEKIKRDMPCFGQENFFSASDEECKNCKYHADCRALVMKSMKS